MKNRFLSLVVMSILMAGCSSTPIKNTPKEETPKPNEKFLEKIFVPSTTQNPTSSRIILEGNKNYRLEVSGTYSAGDTILSDVDYSITKRAQGDFWTDNVTKYEKHGERLLNLLVMGYGNNASIDWGTFDESHVYNSTINGNDERLQFVIYDIYDKNNDGGLVVKIYELE